MRCPFCGVPGQSEVLETRFRSEVNRRRRRCLACEQTFATIETHIADFKRSRTQQRLQDKTNKG
jgi:transcriptional regulator NrdR family protein